MENSITINIVEPGSTPVDPGTGTVVPDTGLFTSGIGGAEAAIIATVALVAILAIVGAIIYYKKKQGKASSLLAKYKQLFRHKKSAAIGLTSLAIVVSLGTVASLVKLGASAEEADNIEAQDSTALTVTAESEELTIELADEPVFAVLPVELTVAEATEAGYTITAYAEDTNLVSTTDPSNVIPMVTLPEPLVPNEEGVGRGWGPVTKLTDNTYGLTLVEPKSEQDELYMPLSISSDNPTIIKSMTEYTPTAANDTTTIYYGFYITPDIPYGTYTNDGEVYYNATINTTLVTFNGNGLYFNEDTSQTTNEVEYIAVTQEESEGTVNQIISGEYKEPSQALPYNFLGWSEEQEATTPTYTSAEDIAQNLPILPNQPIILYAIWQKATTITFDSNDGAGDKTTQTIIAGESDNLNPNEFTREGYTFTGWNTVATPTEQEPGKTYADQAEYTAPADSGYVTLYAQWKALPVIGDLIYMQDFATLTEEDKASVLNSMAQEQQYQLEDSRDHKVYYISRLKDDNVWMTQNLDFNIVNGGAGLDHTNTDVPTNWADAGHLTNTYATNDTTWNWSYTAPESYDPGNLYWNGELNENWNGTLDNMTTTSSSNSHYHIGNYYNWTAAVAMSSSSSYTSDGTDVNQSICPAGWRLPNLSDNKSYQNLVNKQGLSAGTSGNIQNTPTCFVYGGSWGGYSGDVGSAGGYWSSVVGSSGDSYRHDFGVGGGVYPQSLGSRNSGASLRCVAR